MRERQSGMSYSRHHHKNASVGCLSQRILSPPLQIIISTLEAIMLRKASPELLPHPVELGKGGRKFIRSLLVDHVNLRLSLIHI